jgi:hypothetical protein
MSGVAGIIGAAAAIGMVEVAVSAAIEYRRSSQVSIVERLVLPRAVPTAEYSIVTTPVLQYNVAVTESCWRAPLPCAPYQLKPIVLRAPERGLAGGFQSIR